MTDCLYYSLQTKTSVMCELTGIDQVIQSSQVNIILHYAQKVEIYTHKMYHCFKVTNEI